MTRRVPSNKNRPFGLIARQRPSDKAVEGRAHCPTRPRIQGLRTTASGWLGMTRFSLGRVCRAFQLSESTSNEIVIPRTFSNWTDVSHLQCRSAHYRFPRNNTDLTCQRRASMRVTGRAC